jgi:hypothetical protein
MTGQKVEEAAAGQVREFPENVAAEPARYRAIGRLCLEPGWREIAAGACFEFSGRATHGMVPLNAAARKAKLASIDRHWRDNPRPEATRRLARSLGFAGGTDAEAAAHIEKFIRETEIQKEAMS